MDRVILHIDMDAFFAAIEQREHPELKNKPVIVGADPKRGKGRGVVSTCSYEARKFGVHSALPISQAYKLCPQGIYVPPNGRLYSQVSRDIFKLFYEFTDQVEPLSIDEAFLDISGSIKLFGSGRIIGEKLKEMVCQKQSLNASVGIAPNKFIAKIASDLEKPDGLVIVEKNKIQDFLNPLPISKLWGAGEKTIEKLNKLGIRTVGDLAQLPLNVLESRFGKFGKHFYALSRGIDDRDVKPRQNVKSVSNEYTFSDDIDDAVLVKETLLKLTEKVSYRMRKKNLFGRTIHLKLRYQGFETITRNKTIAYQTANTETIFEIITRLFDANYQTDRKIRLLGVGMSSFELKSDDQLSLFTEQNRIKSKLDIVEDTVREKFGQNAISRAEGLRQSNDEERWFE